MLSVARQQTGTTNTDQRLIVVTYQTRVSFLWLQANCSKDDAIKEMQKMFGIVDKSTLENRGCISQLSATIAKATTISQIMQDQCSKARGFQGRLIRLELS